MVKIAYINVLKVGGFSCPVEKVTPKYGSTGKTVTLEMLSKTILCSSTKSLKSTSIPIFWVQQTAESLEGSENPCNGRGGSWQGMLWALLDSWFVKGKNDELIHFQTSLRNLILFDQLWHTMHMCCNEAQIFSPQINDKLFAQGLPDASSDVRRPGGQPPLHQGAQISQHRHEGAQISQHWHEGGNQRYCEDFLLVYVETAVNFGAETPQYNWHDNWLGPLQSVDKKSTRKGFSQQIISQGSPGLVQDAKTLFCLFLS